MKNVLEGKRIWGSLIIFLITLGVTCPPVSHSQVTVSTLAAPVNSLTINDLDYINATTPKWLFTITMFSPQPVQAVMTINLDVYLSSGDTYVNAARFISKPFALNGAKTVTNLELGRTTGIQQREGDGYVFNEQAKAAFQAIALPSGTMPAGSYRFTVEVAVAGGPSDSKDFTFVLTNPSSPVLISPAAGETVLEKFPLFQWQYDGPRATISVYEMLPGQRSLEEVASGTPHATATVTTRTFRYPVSGARPLAPGKTYVWFVKGLAGTAGGTNLELRSTLRTFTVATTQAFSMSQILQELESSLPPKYKPLFDQVRTQNLSPSGTFRLNGSPISMSDLLNVLRDIRANQESVGSVILE